MRFGLKMNIKSSSLIRLLKILLSICLAFDILSVLISKGVHLLENIPLCLGTRLVLGLIDDFEKIQRLPTILQEWITTSHLFII